jgi:hypothetical protein
MNKFIIVKHNHKHTKKALKYTTWWCINNDCNACGSKLPNNCFIMQNGYGDNQKFYIVCSKRCINMCIFQNI